MRYLSREELAERLGLPLRGPTILVTFHPVSLDLGAVGGHVEELLAVLESVEGDVILTYPGADAGSHGVIERVTRFAQARARTRLLTSLGDEAYASLLHHADVMVGNSSSGVIEAASFALPVVNIGDRQRGRVRAANVIDVGHGREEIRGALRRALSAEFRPTLAGLRNPYGDGHAAPRIVGVLERVELGPRLVTKRFVDLP
jgi:UDP-hydrolysing UDP-N-acetyl-D-glucosamine 2-epimerase